MVSEAARPAATVTRNRFMIGVLGGVSALIGLFYVFVAFFGEYPNNTASPPLPVDINDQGVTDSSGTFYPFGKDSSGLDHNGVAGPFNYPTIADRSVVVGVFVEKIDAGGPIAASNLRVVEQTCTHLGCPVNWVPSDNRFECPCHGSQFRRDLSVYHGPAADPLHQHDFVLQPGRLTIEGRKS